MPGAHARPRMAWSGSVVEVVVEESKSGDSDDDVVPSVHEGAVGSQPRIKWAVVPNNKTKAKRSAAVVQTTSNAQQKHRTAPRHPTKRSAASARAAKAAAHRQWEVRPDVTRRPASAAVRQSRVAKKLIQHLAQASHIEAMKRDNMRKHDEIARLKRERRARIAAHKRAKQKKIDDLEAEREAEKKARRALKREAAKRKKELRLERRRRKIEKRAAATLQRHVLGFIARRRVRALRKTLGAASMAIQQQWLAFTFRKNLHKNGVRRRFVTLQRCVRAWQLQCLVARLQAFWRGSIQRYKYSIWQSEMYMAITMIQRLYRLKRLRRWLRNRVTSSVKIQWWIRWRKRVHRRRVAAATKIQAWHRQLKAQRLLQQNKAAAVFVETSFRSYRHRKLYRDQRAAAVVLQKAYRRHLGRKHKESYAALARAARAEYDNLILDKKTAVAVWVQSHARRRLAARAYEAAMRDYARKIVRIQSTWRGFRVYRRHQEFMTLLRARRAAGRRKVALWGQSLTRMWQGQAGFAQFHRSRSAATRTLQTTWRHYKIAALRFLFRAALLARVRQYKLSVAQFMQYMFRKWAGRRQRCLLRAEREKAAVKIQSIYRGCVHSRSYEYLLQAHYAMLAERAAEERRKRNAAAVQVQKVQRGHVGRKIAAAARAQRRGEAAILFLQACWRRKVVARVYANLHSRWKQSGLSIIDFLRREAVVIMQQAVRYFVARSILHRRFEQIHRQFAAQTMQLTTQVSAPSGEALVEQHLLLEHARDYGPPEYVDHTASVQAKYDNALTKRAVRRAQAALAKHSQPPDMMPERKESDLAFETLRNHFTKKRSLTKVVGFVESLVAEVDEQCDAFFNEETSVAIVENQARIAWAWDAGAVREIELNREDVTAPLLVAAAVQQQVVIEFYGEELVITQPTLVLEAVDSQSPLALQHGVESADVVLAVDGKPFEDMASFSNLIKTSHKVKLTIARLRDAPTNELGMYKEKVKHAISARIRHEVRQFAEKSFYEGVKNGAMDPHPDHATDAADVNSIDDSEPAQAASHAGHAKVDHLHLVVQDKVADMKTVCDEFFSNLDERSESSLDTYAVVAWARENDELRNIVLQRSSLKDPLGITVTLQARLSLQSHGTEVSILDPLIQVDEISAESPLAVDHNVKAGDIILDVNGQLVQSMAALSQILSSSQKLSMTVARGKSLLDVQHRRYRKKVRDVVTARMCEEVRKKAMVAYRMQHPNAFRRETHAATASVPTLHHQQSVIGLETVFVSLLKSEMLEKGKNPVKLERLMRKYTYSQDAGSAAKFVAKHIFGQYSSRTVDAGTAWAVAYAEEQHAKKDAAAASARAGVRWSKLRSQLPMLVQKFNARLKRFVAQQTSEIEAACREYFRSIPPTISDPGHSPTFRILRDEAKLLSASKTGLIETIDVRRPSTESPLYVAAQVKPQLALDVDGKKHPMGTAGVVLVEVGRLSPLKVEHGVHAGDVVLSVNGSAATSLAVLTTAAKQSANFQLRVARISQLPQAVDTVHDTVEHIIEVMKGRVGELAEASFRRENAALSRSNSMLADCGDSVNDLEKALIEFLTRDLRTVFPRRDDETVSEILESLLRRCKQCKLGDHELIAQEQLQQLEQNIRTRFRNKWSVSAETTTAALAFAAAVAKVAATQASDISLLQKNADRLQTELLSLVARDASAMKFDFNASKFEKYLSKYKTKGAKGPATFVKKFVRGKFSQSTALAADAWANAFMKAHVVSREAMARVDNGADKLAGTTSDRTLPSIVRGIESMSPKSTRTLNEQSILQEADTNSSKPSSPTQKLDKPKPQMSLMPFMTFPTREQEVAALKTIAPTSQRLDVVVYRTSPASRLGGVFERIKGIRTGLGIRPSPHIDEAVTAHHAQFHISDEDFFRLDLEHGLHAKVVVTRTTRGLPLADCGICKGDIILAVDGEPIHGVPQLISTAISNGRKLMVFSIVRPNRVPTKAEVEAHAKDIITSFRKNAFQNHVLERKRAFTVTLFARPDGLRRYLALQKVARARSIIRKALRRWRGARQKKTAKILVPAVVKSVVLELWKSYMQTEGIQLLCAIKIQNAWRRSVAMREKRAAIAAAVHIQARFRGHSVKENYERALMVKRFRDRQLLQELREASASRIQSWVRAILAQLRHQRANGASTRIQSVWRCFVVHKYFEHQKALARLAQIAADAAAAAEARQRAAAEEQAAREKEMLHRRRVSSIKLQSLWRGYQVNKFSKEQKLIAKIAAQAKEQELLSKARELAAAKERAELPARRHQAAMRIQALWRGHQVHKFTELQLAMARLRAPEDARAAAEEKAREAVREKARARAAAVAAAKRNASTEPQQASKPEGDHASMSEIEPSPRPEQTVDTPEEYSQGPLSLTEPSATQAVNLSSIADDADSTNATVEGAPQGVLAPKQENVATKSADIPHVGAKSPSTDKVNEDGDEKPPSIGEEPAHSTEKPVDIREKPVEVSENPVEVRGKPVKVSEKPVEASEQPAEASEQPVEASEKPVEIRGTSVEVSEKPVEEPSNDDGKKTSGLSKTPTDVGETPLDLSEKRSVVRDKPSDAIKKPAYVAEIPSHTAEQPSRVDENPPRIDSKSLAANMRTSDVPEKPSNLPATSTNSEQSPMSAEVAEETQHVSDNTALGSTTSGSKNAERTVPPLEQNTVKSEDEVTADTNAESNTNAADDTVGKFNPPQSSFSPRTQSAVRFQALYRGWAQRELVSEDPVLQEREDKLLQIRSRLSSTEKSAEHAVANPPADPDVAKSPQQKTASSAQPHTNPSMPRVANFVARVQALYRGWATRELESEDPNERARDNALFSIRQRLAQQAPQQHSVGETLAVPIHQEQVQSPRGIVAAQALYRGWAQRELESEVEAERIRDLNLLHIRERLAKLDAASAASAASAALDTAADDQRVPTASLEEERKLSEFAKHAGFIMKVQALYRGWAVRELESEEEAIRVRDNQLAQLRARQQARIRAEEEAQKRTEEAAAKHAEERRQQRRAKLKRALHALRTLQGLFKRAKSNRQRVHDALVTLYECTGGSSTWKANNWLSNGEVKQDDEDEFEDDFDDDEFDDDDDPTEDGEETQPSSVVATTVTDVATTDGPPSFFRWTGINMGLAPTLTNVVSLTLVDHGLSGCLPAELSQLWQLKNLTIEANEHLVGPIPTEIGTLLNLMSLRMGKNSLSGSIPSELRNLQKLRVLALDGNRLSGPIPPELCELPKLSDLRLHNNHLDQATDFRDAIMAALPNGASIKVMPQREEHNAT